MAKKEIEKVEIEKVESNQYKVISPFQDKNTKEIYNIGDTYEADDKRAAELSEYIEEVKTNE